MLFHEKLYRLRKEQSLTQAALSEKLNITRQALNNWESGRYYPDTEKLQQLCAVFNVSIDFWLNDLDDASPSRHADYYVSCEMAEGFFANQRRWLTHICAGACLFIFGMYAYLKYLYEGMPHLVPILLLLAGMALMMRGFALEDAIYRTLEDDILSFNSTYLDTLQIATSKKIRELKPILYALCAIVALSLLLLWVGEDAGAYSTGLPTFIEVLMVVLALCIPATVYCAAILKGYTMLAFNENHRNRFTVRFVRKARTEYRRLQARLPKK